MNNFKKEHFFIWPPKNTIQQSVGYRIHTSSNSIEKQSQSESIVKAALTHFHKPLSVGCRIGG